jgi:hypothetical protein
VIAQQGDGFTWTGNPLITLTATVTGYSYSKYLWTPRGNLPAYRKYKVVAVLKNGHELLVGESKVQDPF